MVWFERHSAGQDGTEIVFWHQPELDIHICQAQIAVKQKHFLPGLRQSVRECNGKLGLADAALAGGDGNHVAAFGGRAAGR